MISIDLYDQKPIYLQIIDAYKHQILSGELKENDRIPSVRALATELSTNPNTVQKAFVELEREGFVSSVRGRGNFVRNNTELREKKKQEMVKELAAFIKEADELSFSVDELVKEAKKIK